jgi:hypothetical protein
MTDVAAEAPSTTGCPQWCVNDAQGSEGHSHVSADVLVEAVGRPLSARLIQVAGDSVVKVLVNDRVATVDQVETFSHALRGLADEAVPAEPGLGFVEGLLAGISLEEAALASGIELQRLREQRAGGRLLSVREFDRLALAVAHLSVTAPKRPTQPEASAEEPGAGTPETKPAPGSSQ